MSFDDLHDDGRRLAAFLLEHPEVHEAVDNIAAEFDGLVDLYLWKTDAPPLLTNDVVIRRQGTTDPIAVIHPDGGVERFDEED